MRFHLRAVAQRLLFPNGILAVLGLLFVLTYGKRYEPSFGLFAACLLALAGFLAVRVRSLRAFLAILALAAGFAFLRFGLQAPSFDRCATALLAFDLGLLLLLDDAFFDWEVVMWWAGVLSAQWAIFVGAVHWAPSLVQPLDTTTFSLGAAGHLGLVEAVFLAVLLIHLGRFVYSPDPVGAGLVWVLVVLSQGQSHLAAIQGCVALSALILGISATEHSHWIAYHDELTRLPGRRAFNQALAAAGTRYSVAVADVDHFKSFNDTFGHDAGDQVLRKVAAQLARVRNGGTAYRCGGEEFAIFFPGLPLAQAAAAVEEVRSAIEQDAFVVSGPARSRRKRAERRASSRRIRPGSPVETAVTVSIGVAEASRHTNSPEEVVKAADQALYAAKREGRNRVVVSPAPSAREARPRSRPLAKARTTSP
ncbi:MAG: diguanylate cyclase [Terriglobales bacterium]